VQEAAKAAAAYQSQYMVVEQPASAAPDVVVADPVTQARVEQVLAEAEAAPMDIDGAAPRNKRKAENPLEESAKKVKTGMLLNRLVAYLC
jgi:hypothetical protein